MILAAESSIISIPRTASLLWINLWEGTGCCCPMRGLIMDRGAEFGAHRVHEDGKWDSDFKQHLERHGINAILVKVKHPQANGKLERWFGEYQRGRQAFSSFEEFVEWYNNRPHGSLDFEHLETPERAFSEICV